jgi:hypothetical protein
VSITRSVYFCILPVFVTLLKKFAYFIANVSSCTALHDRYWIEQEDREKKKKRLKETQGLFPALSKIELGSKSYVELACVQSFLEATGVQPYGSASLGCAALWVCCAILPRKDSSVLQ